jgi:hypothetical protein
MHPMHPSGASPSPYDSYEYDDPSGGSSLSERRRALDEVAGALEVDVSTDQRLLEGIARLLVRGAEC